MTRKELIDYFGKALIDYSAILSMDEKHKFIEEHEDKLSYLYDWFLEFGEPEETWEVCDTIKSFSVKDYIARKRLKELADQNSASMIISLASLEEVEVMVDQNTIVFNFFLSSKNELYLLAALVNDQNQVVIRKHLVLGKAQGDELINRILQFNNFTKKLGRFYRSAEKHLLEILYFLGAILFKYFKIYQRENLIILPDKLLNNIPLHSIFFQTDKGIYYLDEFFGSIVYGSSFHILRLLRENSKFYDRSNNHEILFFVDKANLPRKGQFEEKFFEFANRKNKERLVNFISSEGEFYNKLDKAGLIFWASHAYVDYSDFTKSKIQFCNKNISFGEIANEWNLEKCGLCFLSACETGVSINNYNKINFTSGLETAFQIAGSDIVVSSFWKIDDKLASLFMMYYYEHLFSDKILPRFAFLEVQKKLRTGKWREAASASYESFKNTGEKKLLEILESLLKYPDNAFSSVLDWSAFKFSGTH